MLIAIPRLHSCSSVETSHEISAVSEPKFTKFWKTVEFVVSKGISVCLHSAVCFVVKCRRSAMEEAEWVKGAKISVVCGPKFAKF